MSSNTPWKTLRCEIIGKTLLRTYFDFILIGKTPHTIHSIRLKRMKETERSFAIFNHFVLPVRRRRCCCCFALFFDQSQLLMDFMYCCFMFYFLVDIVVFVVVVRLSMLLFQPLRVSDSSTMARNENFCSYMLSAPTQPKPRAWCVSMCMCECRQARMCSTPYTSTPSDTDYTLNALCLRCMETAIHVMHVIDFIWPFYLSNCV